MGRHNFDEYIERRGTGCLKWDEYTQKFGVPSDFEMIPMWIADMDFKSPQPVIDELRKRVEHGVFGYFGKDDAFYDSIISWVGRRYGWKIEREWIVFTPGVVPALNIAIQAFTKPGDGVIAQRPVYYNFTDGIINNGRIILNNELIPGESRYEIDFDDLEAKAALPSTKLMLFCTPHNPGGRVWTEQELNRVGEICVRHGVVLLSDEIHADIIMKGYRHISTATLSREIADVTIASFAPSKTFNLAGMQTAYNVIPNPEIRAAFEKQLTANRVFMINAFGGFALRAAYDKCEYYVSEMCDYVEGNIDYAMAYIRDNLPKVSAHRPEGTYLLWVDFRNSGLTVDEMKERMIRRARIAPDFGDWFGEKSALFARLNLACPRALAKRAMKGLSDGFGDL